jgi:hypothetical protein
MNNPFKNIYGTNTSGLELDLRQELHNTLYGSYDEIKKGKVGLIRIMRRNSDNEPIRCPCRDKQTDEPSRDSFCRTCWGMGYLWDEEKIVYYKNEDSFKEDEGFLFYTEYEKDISSIDYIITIKLDKEGEPIIPAERDKVFKIKWVKSFSADRGRLEYYEIRAIEERKWSVWYDVKNRQFI